MFEAIPFDAKIHYEIAVKWYHEHGWDGAPALAELAPNGVVILYEKLPCAMTWVYKSDGNIAWISWIVADRYMKKDIKEYALQHLIDTCELLARGWGYKQLWTSVRLPKIVRRFEAQGFRKGDVKMTNLVKELW